MSLAPLRFRPIFRQYLWGGRRLETVLNKPIGEGPHFAESWEVVDHGGDQSVVAAGPLAGKTLGEVVREDPQGVAGVASASSGFPLLLKYLDCNRNLSVQVHPDDVRAAKLDPPDLGKTEAWYILDAEPGALVYAGLKAGVQRADLEKAIEAGKTDDCLHSFHPTPGDCIFIQAGVIHALGAGLLVAEIQQASDTTYRLFDWNRVGTDGKPRQLHIEAGLEAIDYAAGPIQPQTPSAPAGEQRQQLVDCDKFMLDRLRLPSEGVTLGGDNQFHLITIVEGAAVLEGDPTGEPLSLGQSALIPANSQPLQLRPLDAATVLEAHLPLNS